MVLKRAGNDFRSRGRAAVDQHDDRLALGQIAGPGVEALRFFGVAAAGGDDFTLVQERIRHRDRLIEQAARIVAQIDHEALDLVSAELTGQIADRFLQTVGSLLVELRNADITDIIALVVRTHRLHADHVAHDGDLDRLVRALAHDAKLDLGVHRAAHLFHSLVEREALYLLVVELGDDVVGHDAGFGCRRIIDWSHHLYQPILHGDLDAEAAELAAGLHLNVAEATWIHVARMRIEPGEHAVDRRLDEFVVVRLFDIVGAHLLEHVAEQVELPVGIRGGRGGRFGA